MPLTPEAFTAFVDHTFVSATDLLEHDGYHTETLVLLDACGGSSLLAAPGDGFLAEVPDVVADHARRGGAVAAVHILDAYLHRPPPTDRRRPAPSGPVAAMLFPNGETTRQVLTVVGLWPAAGLRRPRLAVADRAEGRPVSVHEIDDAINLAGQRSDWLAGILRPGDPIL